MYRVLVIDGDGIAVAISTAGGFVDCSAACQLLRGRGFDPLLIPDDTSALEAASRIGQAIDLDSLRDPACPLPGIDFTHFPAPVHGHQERVVESLLLSACLAMKSLAGNTSIPTILIMQMTMLVDEFLALKVALHRDVRSRCWRGPVWMAN